MPAEAESKLVVVEGSAAQLEACWWGGQSHQLSSSRTANRSQQRHAEGIEEPRKRLLFNQHSLIYYTTNAQRNAIGGARFHDSASLVVQKLKSKQEVVNPPLQLSSGIPHSEVNLHTSNGKRLSHKSTVKAHKADEGSTR